VRSVGLRASNAGLCASNKVRPTVRHYRIPIILRPLPSRKSMQLNSTSPLQPERGPSFGPADHTAQEHLMLDVVMLVLGLGLFALGIGYAYACERL